MDDSLFLFVCCQPGAESALKNELAVAHSEWRFAFSRPGFVTFKWTGTKPLSPRFQLKSVFARTHGWSLGPLPAADWRSRVVARLDGLQDRHFHQLHVWQRPRRGPASGLPVVVTEATVEFAEQIRAELVARGRLAAEVIVNQQAMQGQSVLDCVMIAPDQWWLGWHQVAAFGQRWPGGVPQIQEPPVMVSRAYLKMREAMAWSGFPFRAGDRCVELGSAPGGAAQALLEAGLMVMGVDPARMHPKVLSDSNFIHVRKRGAEVRRREYRDYKWLVVDSNVAPTHTLDTVESIVTHPATSVTGLLLTLKLPEWELAEKIVDYVRRVQSWGYDDVRCRQLACNHQEVCLAALRSRGVRRRRSLDRTSENALKQPARNGVGDRGITSERPG